MSHKERIYDRVPHEQADIMTVQIWQGAVEHGWFTTYDGSGYWMKDGRECKEAEVFSSPQSDATHVSWYNK